MRNYLMYFWAGVVFSDGAGGHNLQTFVGEDQDDFNEQVAAYLAFLFQTQPGFEWSVELYVDYLGNTIGGGIPYFFEMKKVTVLSLFRELTSQVWDSDAFGNVMVLKSPRKSWSHGH